MDKGNNFVISGGVVPHIMIWDNHVADGVVIDFVSFDLLTEGILAEAPPTVKITLIPFPDRIPFRADSLIDGAD